MASPDSRGKRTAFAFGGRAIEERESSVEEERNPRKGKDRWRKEETLGQLLRGQYFCNRERECGSGHGISGTWYLGWI